MLLPLAKNESIRGWYYSAPGSVSEVSSCSECGAMPSRIIIIENISSGNQRTLCLCDEHFLKLLEPIS